MVKYCKIWKFQTGQSILFIHILDRYDIPSLQLFWYVFVINKSVQEMLIFWSTCLQDAFPKLAQNVVFISGLVHQYISVQYSKVYIFWAGDIIYELGHSTSSYCNFYHRFFNVKLVGEYGDSLTRGLKGQCQDNADPTARCGQISAGQILPYKWWLVFPKCEWMEKW